MQAGNFNRRIVIKARSTQQDALGQPTETWTELMRAWADVRYRNGLETLAADELRSTVRCSMRVRASSCAQNIVAGHRVVLAGVEHKILAVQPQGLTSIDLVCEVIK